MAREEEVKLVFADSRTIAERGDFGQRDFPYVVAHKLFTYYILWFL